MSATLADDGADLPKERLNDLIELLHDVPEWELPKQRWDMVDEILTSLRDAVVARDLPAFRTATAGLYAIAPIRIDTRVGREPNEDEELPPPKICIRVAELQKQIAPPEPDQSEK